MDDLTFRTVSDTNEARCKRWHPNFPHDRNWNGADWSNAMQSEAGEAGNIVKKLRQLECGFSDFRHNLNWTELHAELADEIADTFLYLDLLATYYNINIEAAIIKKFNEVSEAQQFPERLP